MYTDLYVVIFKPIIFFGLAKYWGDASCSYGHIQEKIHIFLKSRHYFLNQFMLFKNVKLGSTFSKRYKIVIHFLKDITRAFLTGFIMHTFIHISYLNQLGEWRCCVDRGAGQNRPRTESPKDIIAQTKWAIMS